MILISILIATVATVLMLVFVNTFSSASKKYKADVASTAKNDFADMFMFIDPSKLLILNLLLVFIGGGVVWFFTGLWPLGLIVAFALLYLPQLFLIYLKKKRKNDITNQLPDTLLSLSRSMQAGTSLPQAIEITIEEDKGPLIQELSLFQRELRVGTAFNEALKNMDERIETEEFSLAASGMMISREIGGNLAETLDRLADLIRRKVEMEGKIKALTSQGRLQGIVMSVLPFMVGLAIYKIEPVYMMQLFYHPIGWGVIAFVLIMEGFGYYFIQKIVNIDV